MFYDLYKSLSKTDYERRFFNFQVKLMEEIFHEMDNSLALKDIFSFPDLDNNTRSQMLECIFPQTGKALKTVPMRVFDEESNNHFYFASYEQKIAEYSELGARVDVIDKYSMEYINQGLNNLRTNLYLDLLFQQGKKAMALLSCDEIKRRVTIFIHSVLSLTSNELANSLNLKNINNLSSLIGANNFESLMKETKKIINNIGENPLLDEYIYIHEDKIIVEFYLIFTQKSEANVTNELSEYLSTGLYKIQVEKFLSTLHINNLSYEWYVPCVLAHVDSSIFFYKNKELELGIVKSSDLIDRVSALPKEFNLNNRIDSRNRFYFYGKIFSQSLDVRKSLELFKDYVSEFLDYIYFMEEIPFPSKLLWKQAFCLIENSDKYVRVTDGGWKRDFSPLLDGTEFLDKIDVYGKIVELKNKSPENDLVNRFLYSLKLYREHLLLESLEDQLLKLWNILEVITQQDNVDKISSMAAHFPIIFPNEIFNKTRIDSLSSIEKKEYFKLKLGHYTEIIADIGSLRNKYVAHKNRAIKVSEMRFEKNLTLLRLIVRQSQTVIWNYLNSDLEITKVKEVINDIKSRVL